MDQPKELPKVLQDVLSVSADSAYRRLRGETALSIDEAFKLANHFKVAISDLESFRSDHLTFIKRPFINSLERFELFMRESLEHLQQVLADPSHLMIYTAKDVPIFYQYKFRELAAFKIYVWLRSIYDVEKINDEYYDLSSIPETLLELAEQQWEVYSKMNVIEIWNETTMLSMINQIEYYYEAGLLTGKEQALAICDQVKEMLRIIYKQALHGKRVDENFEDTEIDYRLYYNEVLIMDNNILSRFNNRLVYNIPYAAVNYFTTTNEEVTKDMFDYVMRQAHKSSLISNVSEKDRNKFFIRLRNQIVQLEQRIAASDPFII